MKKSLININKQLKSQVDIFQSVYDPYSRIDHQWPAIKISSDSING
jgi:hypothetical protein